MAKLHHGRRHTPHPWPQSPISGCCHRTVLPSMGEFHGKQFALIVGDSHLRSFVDGYVAMPPDKFSFGFMCTPGASANALRKEIYHADQLPLDPEVVCLLAPGNNLVSSPTIDMASKDFECLLKAALYRWPKLFVLEFPIRFPDQHDGDIPLDYQFHLQQEYHRVAARMGVRYFSTTDHFPVWNSMASGDQIEIVGQVLVDPAQDLTRRFRALFTLRNLGGAEAIQWIAKAFSDESALLKHELAYCLGQMQDRSAIPTLTHVLRDTQQEPMVRHEAGEALGAIGDPVVLDLLKEYSQDPVIEVAETCQLAVQRLEWLMSGGEKEEEGGATDGNPYCSVDPAPPALRKSVPELRSALLDESLPMFERYRAMFALRNLGNEEAVLALGDGLQCSSALFRHEVGYVLGQMQHPAAVPALRAALERSGENAMVRHEAAEALGSIGREECVTVLQRYRGDQERVVKESCEVALDMLEYENSSEFQYADGLVRLQG